MPRGVVRRFSSQADSTLKKWDGGPPTEPALPAAAGLNRFVWDLRYPTMTGMPGAYLEAGYRGHKAPPGKYVIAVTLGNRTVTTDAEILPNPLYATDAAAYAEYHQFMSGMEREVSTMHETVNRLHAVQEQLSSLLATLPAGEQFAAIKRDGDALNGKLKAWDEDMIQRRSKAYDDVENFPQKFTANYLFLINQTESDLPRVNQPSRDLRAELEKQWAALKARSDALATVEIPALNRKLWEAGIGAIGRNPNLVP